MKSIYTFGAIVVSLVTGVYLWISITKSVPLVKLTVVGTNDIHGKYYSTLLSRQDTLERYAYGGLEVMASLVQILRNQNPRYFLYLDAGDQFQGGFESSKEVSSGQIISDYFNHLHLAGSALGNHEFDFGQLFLDKYLLGLHNKILSANLIDSSREKTSPDYLPLRHQKKSKLYSFQIGPQYQNLTSLSQVRVGVIGLATLQTPYTTSGFIENLFPQSYCFEQYKSIVIEQSDKLKKKKANIVILVSHVGNQCGRDTTFGIWTQKNMGDINECAKNDQIFTLIDSLPQKTIDIVIQGHRHSTNHYFYKGIPIMGNINDGNYLNVLHVDVTLNQRSIQINRQTLKIEGPVPVCEKVFQNTKKCEYVKRQDLKVAGSLVHWDFHGVKVQKDTQLSNLAKRKWGKIMEKYEVEIVHNFISFPLEKVYAAQNPLGNLITNLMANYLREECINFDFIIYNSGGFRSAWYPGVIRYAELHSMFPFDNVLSFFDVSGKNLRKLIETIQNGKKGFYPTWGLCQVFKINPEKDELNLIQLITKENSPIIDSKIYKIATNDFLVSGGDDFKNVTKYLVNHQNTNVTIRQIIRIQLGKMDSLTEENLKNPSNLQRIVIIQ